MDFSWLFAVPILLFPFFSFIRQIPWKRKAVIIMVISCSIETIVSILNEVIGKVPSAVTNLAAAGVIFMSSAMLMWLKVFKQYNKFKTQDTIRFVANILHVFFRGIEMYLALDCKEHSWCHNITQKYNLSAVGALLAIAATAENLISWKDETSSKKSYTIVMYGSARSLVENGTDSWDECDNIQINLRRQKKDGVLVSVLEVEDIDTLISVGAKVADVMLIHWEVGKPLPIPEEKIREVKASDTPSILVGMTSTTYAQHPPSSLTQHPAPTALTIGAPSTHHQAPEEPFTLTHLQEGTSHSPVGPSSNVAQFGDSLVNLHPSITYQVAVRDGSSYRKNIGAEKYMIYNVDDKFSMKKVFTEALAYKM